MEEPTEISLRHLDLSDNFFDLVQAVLEENIKQGNKTISVQTPSKNNEERIEKYRNNTKWSDNRILIPVLFNFFHGIELLLKGFKYLNNSQQEKNPNHDLKNLFDDFKKTNPSKTNIINILEYYIIPSQECPILFNFYKNNKIQNSSKFYDVFKYPSNKSFRNIYNFSNLKRNGDDGIAFFKRIIEDIKALRKEKDHF